MSRKPFLTFVAIPAASVLAVLGITACGNGSSDDATVVQAAATPQFLNESADRTAAVESGRFEMSVDVPASSQVPSGFSIKGSGAFDLANKKSDTTIDLGGLIEAAKAGDDAESLALLGDGKFEIITDDASVYVHAGFLSAFLGGDDAKPWVKLPANDKSRVGHQRPERRPRRRDGAPRPPPRQGRDGHRPGPGRCERPVDSSLQRHDHRR